jgi:hypothetical protein
LQPVVAPFAIQNTYTKGCLAVPSVVAEVGVRPIFHTAACQSGSSPIVDALWRFDARGNVVHSPTGYCLNVRPDGQGNAFLALDTTCDSPLYATSANYQYVAQAPFFGQALRGTLLRERNAPNRCMVAFQGTASNGKQPLVFPACDPNQPQIQYDLLPLSLSQS